MAQSIQIQNKSIPSKVANGSQNTVSITLKNTAEFISPTDPNLCNQLALFSGSGLKVRVHFTVNGRSVTDKTKCVPAGGGTKQYKFTYSAPNTYNSENQTVGFDVYYSGTGSYITSTSTQVTVQAPGTSSSSTGTSTGSSNVISVAGKGIPSSVNSGGSITMSITLKNTASVISPTDPNICNQLSLTGGSGLKVTVEMLISGVSAGKNTLCVPGGGGEKTFQFNYQAPTVSSNKSRTVSFKITYAGTGNLITTTNGSFTVTASSSGTSQGSVSPPVQYITATVSKSQATASVHFINNNSFAVNVSYKITAAGQSVGTVHGSALGNRHSHVDITIPFSGIPVGGSKQVRICAERVSLSRA